jgi:hypothetical protein
MLILAKHSTVPTVCSAQNHIIYYVVSSSTLIRLPQIVMLPGCVALSLRVALWFLNQGDALNNENNNPPSQEVLLLLRSSALDNVPVAIKLSVQLLGRQDLELSTE